MRPEAKVVLRWACLQDTAHPLDFSDRQDVEIFYARDNRELKALHRDYGLCAGADGSLQPLACPCGGGIRFISRSCVPFLMVHGTAMLPVPGR